MNAIEPAQPPAWRIFVPLETPSLNRTMRMHWGAATKLKRQWMTLLKLAGATSIPCATGRRKLIVERHSPRALDADNLAGGCKIIVDNIRELGLLVDDRPKYAELVYRWVKTSRGERPYTVVQLEDLHA